MQNPKKNPPAVKFGLGIAGNKECEANPFVGLTSRGSRELGGASVDSVYRLRLAWLSSEIGGGKLPSRPLHFASFAWQYVATQTIASAFLSAP
jgi:hypothetical protein